MKRTKSNEGYSVRRLTREGIKALSGNEGLIGQLTDVACSGFGSDMSYEDVKDHILGGDTLYLVYQGENPAGFASFLNYDIVIPAFEPTGFLLLKRRLEDINYSVLFLDGIVVGKEHQGKGIGSHIIKSEIEYQDSTDGILAFRTQSPVMYATVRNLNRYFFPLDFGLRISRIYPNSSYGIPLEDSLLAMEIAKRRYGVSLPADFVMRGVRSGAYKDLPKHPVADELFGNMLKVNVSAGDFVFVLANTAYRNPGPPDLGPIPR